jgi:hypothetical protein
MKIRIKSDKWYRKPVFEIGFLWITFFMFSSCGKSGEDCPQLQLLDVFPNNNVSNGPVLLYGSGFTDATLVRFEMLNAEVVDRNEKYLSVKAPAGLQGLVEVSVSNGDNCLAVRDFEVVGSLPANLPASPPVYLIPPAGYAFPVQIGQDETLYLTNLYDQNHKIEIPFFRFGGGVDVNSTEFYKGQEFPITGSIDMEENRLEFDLDRSADPNLPDDQLVGGFYTLTLPVNNQPTLKNYFIAFSTQTGRQYVFR